MVAQQSAYYALVVDGGRPSHPLDQIQKVVTAPGEHRDIVSYWQNRPDEWQLFTKQLSPWQDFRRLQANMRKTGRKFLVYKVAFGVYLRQLSALTSTSTSYLGFSEDLSLQGQLATSLQCVCLEDLRLSGDPSKQSKLVTWAEYVWFEDMAHRRYGGQTRRHESQYMEAWCALVDSGVLQSDEECGDARQRVLLARKLCNQSSTDLALRLYQKRSSEETVDEFRHAAEWNAKETKNYFKAEGKLKSMESRERKLSEFKKLTLEYRLAEDKVERHAALLRWAVDQVRLVEAEEGLPTTTTTLPERANEENAQEVASKPTEAFFPFRRPPAELRHQIWTENLPPRPTAHFFEVLNHPRKYHLRGYWSEEFRVKATVSHDSGYHAVYPLLAACPESRTVIAEYYRRLQDRDCVDSSEWQYPYPIFQSFDWIAPDDLVILCFPPKEAPLDFERNAISFTRGPPRHVGVYLPMEELLLRHVGFQHGLPPHDFRPEALVLIAQFLDSLRGQRSNESGTGAVLAESPRATPSSDGGIKKIYILYEGWHNTAHWSSFAAKRADRLNWISFSRAHPCFYWRFGCSKAKALYREKGGSNMAIPIAVPGAAGTSGLETTHWLVDILTKLLS
ncbi:uncharacterized protein B0T15DRAFT_548096 [Chaetomium strumarium]|uniref:2EXR domain-containing protein n=1 Tax=Chaetomium strumarium TaxID=1170767 RepID=A0AAJ0M6M4_9PEZI|nr:hypothetical protein B0T15DRAFT_548096 [Chaetomium strumarium]